MGTFQARFEILRPDGSGAETVEALVDTGATYTVLPGPMLRRLNIAPLFRFPFILADGRRIEREVGETRVRLDGQTRTTLVVFGEEGSPALLGAYTLEGFGLIADSLNKRLLATPGLLMTSTMHRIELASARIVLPHVDQVMGARFAVCTEESDAPDVLAGDQSGARIGIVVTLLPEVDGDIRTLVEAGMWSGRCAGSVTHYN